MNEYYDVNSPFICDFVKPTLIQLEKGFFVIIVIIIDKTLTSYEF